jgi:nicotinate-nucleotide pyrophosphorylase
LHSALDILLNHGDQVNEQKQKEIEERARQQLEEAAKAQPDIEVKDAMKDVAMGESITVIKPNDEDEEEICLGDDIGDFCDAFDAG